MSNLDEIEAEILALPSTERRDLIERLCHLATEVGESAPAYRFDTGTPVLSVEEYLRLEEVSQIKHEYIGGALYAMSGVSESHQLIAGNLFAAFHNHLRSGPCRPYMADFKLRLQMSNEDVFYYPDVMVACRREGVEKFFLRFPALIVEVLSPSTAAIDRREKRINYAQISSVEEYVIASQEARELLCHRRASNWVPERVSGPEASLELRSIGLTLPLADIYERVF